MSELATFKLNSLSMSAWMNGEVEIQEAETFLISWSQSLKSSHGQFIKPLSKLISNLLTHILKGAIHQHSMLTRLISLALDSLTLLSSTSSQATSNHELSMYELVVTQLAFNLLQSLFDATMKSQPDAASTRNGDPNAKRPPLLNIKRHDNDTCPLPPKAPRPASSQIASSQIRRDRLSLLLLSLPLLDTAIPCLMERGDERSDKVVSILSKILKHQEEGEGDQDGAGRIISGLKRHALKSLGLASDLNPEAIIPTCNTLHLNFFIESLMSDSLEDADDLLKLLHLRLISDRSLSSDDLTRTLFDLVQRLISPARSLRCLEPMMLNSTRAPRSDSTRNIFSSSIPLLLALAVKTPSNEEELSVSVAALNVLSAIAQDDSLAPLLTSDDLGGEGSITDYIAAGALSLSQDNCHEEDPRRRSYLRFLHNITGLCRLPGSSLPVVASALLSLLASSSSCTDSLMAAHSLSLLVTTEGNIVCGSLIDQNALPLIQALIRADPSISSVGDQQYLTSSYRVHDEAGDRLVGTRYEVDKEDEARSGLRRALGAILDELLVFRAVSSPHDSDTRQALQRIRPQLPLPPLPPPQSPLPLTTDDTHPPTLPYQQEEDEVIKSLALNEGDSVQFDQEVLVQGEPMRVISVVRSVKKGASTSYTFEDRVFSVPSTPSNASRQAAALHSVPSSSRPHLPTTPGENLGKKVASILQLSSSSSAIRGSEFESPRKMKRRTIEDIVASALRPSTPCEEVSKKNPQSLRGSAKKTPQGSDLAKLTILAGKYLLRSTPDRKLKQEKSLV